jgi:hypothetical protein
MKDSNNSHKYGANSMKVHEPAAVNMWAHVNDASWQKGCPKIQGLNFLIPKHKTKKNT